MAIDFKKGEATIAAMKAAKAANPNATFTSADIASGNIPAPAPPSVSSSSPSYSSSAPSYSVPAPSLGSQYQNVPGTNWQSTNPSNPNSAKYYADGTPVPSVSFDHTATGGSKFSGYTNPEQFNAIMRMSNDQPGLSNYLENNKGSFVSNDSIYKNVPAPGNTGINPSAGIMASDKPWERSGFGSVYAPSSGTNGGWNPNGGGAPADSNRTSRTEYNQPVQTGQLVPKPQQTANDRWNSSVGRGGGVYNPTTINDNFGFGFNPDRPSDALNRGGYIGGQSANSVPAPAAPQSMEDKIRAEVKARSDKQRAGIASAVDYTKTGLKNSYDYTRGLQKDERVLEDQSFQRNNNPFSGATDYRGAMMDRNRSIADTARDKDYNAEVGAADRRLADFDALAPEQQDAMFNELQRIERQYGLEVANQTGYFNGQRNMAGQQMDFNQADANRRFNYGAGRDAVSDARYADETGYNRGRDSKNDAINADTTIYNRGQDAIKNTQTEAIITGDLQPYSKEIAQMNANSAAWFNASPQERARLAAENQTISKRIGAVQDANGDWIMPQAQRTIAGKQADIQAITSALQQEGTIIKNDLAKLELASFPEEQRLKIEHLKKQIAQIGKAPYQSAADAEYDREKVNLIKAQIEEIKNPPSKTPTPTTNQKQSGYLSKIDKIPESSRRSFFESEKNQIINDLGIDGYEKLKEYYKIY